MLSLLMGLVGFSMVFSALAQGTITGFIIGVNSTSKFLGAFGVILMITAIIIDRYDFDKRK